MYQQGTILAHHSCSQTCLLCAIWFIALCDGDWLLAASGRGGGATGPCAFSLQRTSFVRSTPFEDHHCTVQGRRSCDFFFCLFVCCFWVLVLVLYSLGWPVYTPWSRLFSHTVTAHWMQCTALDVYFITGVESNRGDGDLSHGFIWIKRYYFCTPLCHDSWKLISVLCISVG